MREEIKLILLGSISNRTEEEEELFEKILEQKLDWAWITGQLIRHRLNGNFYSCMTKKQRGYIIDKVRQTFDMLSCCYEACNKINLDFIQKLFEKCNEADIPVAGLKGVIFNTTIYPLSSRKSNDVDVLVKEKDLKIFDQIMSEMGLIQSLDGGRSEASKKEKVMQRMNHHDLVPYFKRIELPYMDCIKVDVNFQFDTNENEITDQILSDGLQIYKGNGYNVQGLIWQNHLLHLCVHFYREASNSLWTSTARDVDLYKLVDIENTFRKYSGNQLIDWVHSVQKYSLNDQCYFTLYYLNQFYPCKTYSEVMHLIEPKDLSFISEVRISGENRVEERKTDFFDQTFNMSYGTNFLDLDLSRVF